MKKAFFTLAAIAASLGGSAYAGDQEVLNQEFQTATAVTSCSEIVVIVITTADGKTYVVDRDSGIPADAIKRAIQASHADVKVYEIGCDIPEIRT